MKHIKNLELNENDISPKDVDAELFSTWEESAHLIIDGLNKKGFSGADIKEVLTTALKDLLAGYKN